MTLVPPLLLDRQVMISYILNGENTQMSESENGLNCPSDDPTQQVCRPFGKLSETELKSEPLKGVTLSHPHTVGFITIMSTVQTSCMITDPFSFNVLPKWQQMP